MKFVSQSCLETSTSAGGLQSKSELQAFFALPPTEELLEKFGCTLLQSYGCINNHFTTPRQVCTSLKIGTSQRFRVMRLCSSQRELNAQ